MTSDECKALKSWISDRGFKNINQKGKDIIIEALEKQIPKKPFKESLADRLCTVCNSYINFDALNDDIESAPLFCINCGQALDWSDQNDVRRSNKNLKHI